MFLLLLFIYISDMASPQVHFPALNFFNIMFFLDAVVCASCSSPPGDFNCFRVCFPLSRHCKNMHILSLPFPPPNMHTLSCKKAFKPGFKL